MFLFVAAFATISTVSARQQTKKTSTPAVKPASAPLDPSEAKSLGSKSAPITIEVFEDFQCPACRNFFETTVKQLIDDYVVPGKVYLIHRDFPLEMHPYSRQAARLDEINAAIERDRTIGVKRNVSQTPSIYVTSHGKTEALPGGGVDYK